MRIFKKLFRLTGLIILILIASTGIFAGALMLPKTKEKFMNKEITIELVEKKCERDNENVKT